MAIDYSMNVKSPLSLVESVRKRPGMYFGNINPLALNSAIYESVANVVDLYLAGSVTKVSVNVNEDIIRVSDDGPGLPFEQSAPIDDFSCLAEYYLVHRHDSPTADNHAPHIHLVGGGLGLAVVNAGSEYIKVTSSNGIYVWDQLFGKGKVLGIPTKVKSEAPSGTIFEFKLDKSIFGDHKPDLFDLRKTMFELAHFYPGLIVEFQDERFVSRSGLLDLACIHYQDKPAAWAIDPPVKYFYEGILDGIQVQVAAIGETDNATDYLSWVNGAPSVEGGAHVDALSHAFNAVSWNPKLALIHVVMHDPRFAGPSKDALRSTEVNKVIRDLLIESLKVFRRGKA
jgi:DNA gyrase subunit B